MIELDLNRKAVKADGVNYKTQAMRRIRFYMT